MVKDPGIRKIKWFERPLVWLFEGAMYWHKEDGRKALPDHLRDRRHWDFFWPFDLIPRWATSFEWGVPTQILGNQKETQRDTVLGQVGPDPIGEPGSWQISIFPSSPFGRIPIYFAVTFSSGLHARVGCRWDDVDSYCTFPTVVIRKPNTNWGSG